MDARLTVVSMEVHMNTRVLPTSQVGVVWTTMTMMRWRARHQKNKWPTNKCLEITDSRLTYKANHPTCDIQVNPLHPQSRTVYHISKGIIPLSRR